MDLHNQLLLWRREHALTQATVAELAGVSRATYNHWETGKTRPPVGILGKLAAARQKQLLPGTRPTPATHPQMYDKWGPDMYVRNNNHPGFADFDDPTHKRHVGLRRWLAGQPLERGNRAHIAKFLSHLSRGLLSQEMIDAFPLPDGFAQLPDGTWPELPPETPWQSRYPGDN